MNDRPLLLLFLCRILISGLNTSSWILFFSEVRVHTYGALFFLDIPTDSTRTALTSQIYKYPYDYCQKAEVRYTKTLMIIVKKQEVNFCQPIKSASLPACKEFIRNKKAFWGNHEMLTSCAGNESSGTQSLKSLYWVKILLVK